MFKHFLIDSSEIYIEDKIIKKGIIGIDFQYWQTGLSSHT
jgi:hypothetical protein